MFYRPYPHRIRELREQAGLSMNYLSKKADLSSASVFRIESGATARISHFRAEAIARILGCKVEDICEIPADKKVG